MPRDGNGRPTPGQGMSGPDDNALGRSIAHRRPGGLPCYPVPVAAHGLARALRAHLAEWLENDGPDAGAIEELVGAAGALEAGIAAAIDAIGPAGGVA